MTGSTALDVLVIESHSGAAQRHVAMHPTDREQGVSCAIRAGVSIVEDGPVVLDPFEAYVDVRVTGDLVETCEDAAEAGFDRIREAIVERCETVLVAAGVTPDAAGIVFQRAGQRLTVRLHGAPISKRLEGTLAVAVAGAVRDDVRTFDGIDVGYRADATEIG